MPCKISEPGRLIHRQCETFLPSCAVDQELLLMQSWGVERLHERDGYERVFEWIDVEMIR